MEDIIKKIQEKKEFSYLPASLILRTLSLKEIEKIKDEKEKIKNCRAILRKYFSVFLSNKIVSGKLSADEVLKKHISSKDRDYNLLYSKIFSGGEKRVIDLGCGVNGLSYNYIRKYCDAQYVGVEATRVLADLTNDYFEKNNFDGKVVWGDLFDLDFVLKIVKGEKKPRVIFMFNIIDALEFFERDYSKKLISGIMGVLERDEKIVLSYPTQSLGKKKKFEARRSWILDFIFENFSVLDDFSFFGERFLVFGKK